MVHIHNFNCQSILSRLFLLPMHYKLFHTKFLEWFWLLFCLKSAGAIRGTLNKQLQLVTHSQTSMLPSGGAAVNYLCEWPINLNMHIFSYVQISKRKLVIFRNIYSLGVPLSSIICCKKKYKQIYTVNTLGRLLHLEISWSTWRAVFSLPTKLFTHCWLSWVMLVSVYLGIYFRGLKSLILVIVRSA